MKYQLVSIIIPTRNSIRTIEKVLKSIKKQAYPRIEVIVVDQQSTDGTIETAKKYADRVIITKGDKFYSAPPVSRNMGAKASKGKYLFHIDSDMELNPKIVKECVEMMEKDPELLAIKVHEKDIGEGFWSKAKKLERSCYVGYDLIEAARFIRGSVFKKLGGYDETLRSAEDWDMSQRIKELGKIDEAKTFTTHHLGRMSYWYQVKKKFNYGLTLNQIINKHNFTPKNSFLFVFRTAYLKNLDKFAKDPVATLGFLVLRSSELMAYLAGVVWARMTNLQLE